MKKTKTPSFVLTLPLSYEEWQKVKLDTLFRVCGEASNNLISDRRKALEQLERTKQWKTVQTKIVLFYSPLKKMSLQMFRMGNGLGCIHCLKKADQSAWTPIGKVNIRMFRN